MPNTRNIPATVGVNTVADEIAKEQLDKIKRVTCSLTKGMTHEQVEAFRCEALHLGDLLDRHKRWEKLSYLFWALIAFIYVCFIFEDYPTSGTKALQIIFTLALSAATVVAYREYEKRSNVEDRYYRHILGDIYCG